MTEFTPIPAFLGGLLIGSATLVLILFNGKIAGISGITKGIFSKGVSDKSWRIVFVMGLVAGGYVFVSQFPGKTALSLNLETPLAVIAGLLVGVGTSLGNGCTSGHGICGLSRFSKRSLVATLIFMASGMLTVFVARHWGGWL